MIVGTAGHIDHGKTSLVRALTGVDTDRLKEEKARGISIELGYAYTPLPDVDVLGFVDVPGHEKLIHTMAAGAVGIDFALLVVAADDGIMPQTREHLAILSMLGVRRGVVALSKADRVDAGRLATLTQEIHRWLAGTPLAQSEVVPVSSTTPDDPGVAALRERLVAAAQALKASGNAIRRDDALFRQAVDRVFTLPGHGTVVTGTAFAGTVRVGDSLRVMPQGVPVRVRSIHAQNRPVDAGRAGERCALNLAGVEREQLGRGDWIVADGLSAPSTHIDVDLHWFERSHDSGEFRHRLRPLSGHKLGKGCVHSEADGECRPASILDQSLGRIEIDRSVCPITVPARSDRSHAMCEGGGDIIVSLGPSRQSIAPKLLGPGIVASVARDLR